MDETYNVQPGIAGLVSLSLATQMFSALAGKGVFSEEEALRLLQATIDKIAETHREPARQLLKEIFPSAPI